MCSVYSPHLQFLNLHQPTERDASSTVRQIELESDTYDLHTSYIVFWNAASYLIEFNLLTWIKKHKNEWWSQKRRRRIITNIIKVERIELVERLNKKRNIYIVYSIHTNIFINGMKAVKVLFIWCGLCFAILLNK